MEPGGVGTTTLGLGGGRCGVGIPGDGVPGAPNGAADADAWPSSGDADDGAEASPFSRTILMKSNGSSHWDCPVWKMEAKTERQRGELLQSRCVISNGEYDAAYFGIGVVVIASVVVVHVHPRRWVPGRLSSFAENVVYDAAHGV